MTDRWVVITVVICLAVLAVLSVGCVGVLALNEKPVPDALIAISSGAVGALSALLARTGTEPTVVENKAVAIPGGGDDFGGGVG